MRNVVFSILSFLVVCGVVLAQVPVFINIQGQLLQKEYWDEEDWMVWPVREGEVAMSFRLYTSAAGGGPVWFENHSTVVTNYDGVYNVQLGLQTPLTLPSMQQYWLGVQVNTNEEMSPRLPLGSVLSSLAVHGLDLTPRSAAPYLCTPDYASQLALTSNYALCVCNGNSWRFVGYGTACQW